MILSYLFQSINLHPSFFVQISQMNGSRTIRKLFSIMCQIILDSRLPENYRHGLVFIYISHTLPLFSIKKSQPNTQKPIIFFYPCNLSQTAFILKVANFFIQFIVDYFESPFCCKIVSISLYESLLHCQNLPQSFDFF